jgi:hypothetical protein
MTLKNEEKLIELMDKAGGLKLKQLKELNFSERMKIVFNFWAYFFTFFYYIYKRMWKKGIVLALISIVIASIVEFFIPSSSKTLWIISSTLFATRANIDLYKKHKLNQNGWF